MKYPISMSGSVKSQNHNKKTPTGAYINHINQKRASTLISLTPASILYFPMDYTSLFHVFVQPVFSCVHVFPFHFLLCTYVPATLFYLLLLSMYCIRFLIQLTFLVVRTSFTYYIYVLLYIFSLKTSLVHRFVCVCFVYI